jgi:hypothetical protein
MRVRENLPPLTLRLSHSFVNNKTPVSTGFSRFFPIFFEIAPIYGTLGATANAECVGKPYPERRQEA